MAKWDKTTRQAWEKSVVAQEFEKNIIELARRLELMSKAQVTSTISEKGKQIEESLKGATNSVGELVDAAKNLTDDAEAEAEEEDQEPIVPEAEEEEREDATASLLEELKQAAEAAADLGNIKLAYRIERTIAEISGE
nr:hypothetical protein 62 [bacterium]